MKTLAWLTLAMAATALSGCTAEVGEDEADATSKLACYTPETAVCDAPPPTPAKGSWRHSVKSTLTKAAGSPHHRGRDLFVQPGDEQWVLAKFAYGVVDKDLHDEDV